MLKKRTQVTLFAFMAFSLFLSSCSINRIAVNMISDALTGDGNAEVFMGDSDPQLVADALPFAIKMYESLLSINPTHQGLILTTGSLFVMYANAFVQGPAEQLPQSQFMERQAALTRARNFYLRGFEILSRGFELRYPGFSKAFAEGNLEGFLARMRRADVPALYWAAAAGLSAFSLNVFDLDLGMRLPEFLAMIERAYELDPYFNYGALDELLMLFHASVPMGMGGDISRVETHFRQAVEKSNGNSAGVFVAHAQSVSIPAQNYERFREALEKAIAVDVDANPSNRLVNIISQQKARFLLDSAPRFFLQLDADDWDYWDEYWD